MSAFGSKLTAPPEAILNRWIAGSTAAREAVRDLEGRSMLVEIDPTSWRIRMHVEQQRVRVDAVAAGTGADIVVRAGIADLVGLLAADSAARLQAGQVEFRGSLRVAEQFSRMLRLARPELEDELAGWIGGVPAHVVGVGLAAAWQWSRRTRTAFAANAVEYLQRESDALPLPAEVSEFGRAVEQLRDDVERMRQRVEAIARRPGRVSAP